MRQGSSCRCSIQMPCSSTQMHSTRQRPCAGRWACCRGRHRRCCQGCSVQHLLLLAALQLSTAPLPAPKRASAIRCDNHEQAQSSCAAADNSVCPLPSSSEGKRLCCMVKGENQLGAGLLLAQGLASFLSLKAVCDIWICTAHQLHECSQNGSCKDAAMSCHCPPCKLRHPVMTGCLPQQCHAEVLQVCINGQSAEGIASLVDMSADEVSDILAGGAGKSSSSSWASMPVSSMLELVENTCRQAASMLAGSSGTTSEEWPYRLR